MSRDELNAAEREELAALDRILAREPVDERHLELAALVDSVRAGAPRMDPAFAERLDAQIARRGGRRSRRVPRLADHGLRRLSLAGGGLVAAAVAFTIVISSGVLNGATTPAQRTPRGLAASGTLAPHDQAGVAGKSRAPVAVAPGLPASTATSGPSATAGGGALPAAGFGAVAPGRLVHSDATLTLATSPSTMQAVADQIVAATERQGGVVATSNVNIQGSSSSAGFSLRVPSGHLRALISTLSSLASVRALNQGTQDITDGYDQEQARLADNVAERAALLKQLASAATLAEQATIRRQLAGLATRIAAEHRLIDRLLTQGRTASLAVTVVPGAARRSAVGPFTTAFNRSLHALEEILAIALVVLAIVLPFALTALALWWGLAVVRQRARERAMRPA